MKIEYHPRTLYKTTPTIHIDSETPVGAPFRAMHLSVTGWFETATGEVGSRNVFVTLDREALIGLQATIDEALLDIDTSKPKIKRKRK